MQVALCKVTMMHHLSSLIKFNQNSILKCKTVTFNHGVVVKIISVKFQIRAECQHTAFHKNNGSHTVRMLGVSKFISFK